MLHQIDASFDEGIMDGELEGFTTTCMLDATYLNKILAYGFK